MSDYDLARSQYETYRYCYDNGHSEWIKSASQCFDFWRGNQWDPAVKAKLEREGRPALTLNITESLIRSMRGIQRALRNDCRYAPVAGATLESAKVKDAIWLDVQNQNQFEFLEAEIWEKGLIMDRGYYDVRVDYNASLMGQIKIRGRRSQDVVLDPSIESYDPDDWPQVFTRRWVSYDDILLQYGKEKADALSADAMPSWYDYEDIFMAQQMGALPYYSRAYCSDMDMRQLRGHLLLERQYAVVKNKECFVDVETGDFSEIPEDWDHNRISRVLNAVSGMIVMKRKVRTLRWTVSCEDEILHDEDSPYEHFTIVPFFPSFIDGVTKGIVRDLIDPQQLYNKMTSSELHIISTTANSGYKIKAGSLKNMTIEELEEAGARTGFVAVLDDISNMDKFQPNQTPQGHDRLSFKADSIMRSLSGVSNQARGFAREDVAGEAILANQAAQDINFAGWLGNLHRTKQMVARNVLSCAQAHYTETRTLMINRGSALVPNMQQVTLNQPTPEGMVLNDVTRGKYTTVLVPSPSRTTMSEADFQLLLDLRKEVGIAIPDQLLIELSPASNKAQIIEAIGGGPDSNDRQRQAEELAAQQQQIDAEKASAQAQKDQAAAQLNQARAEKAQVEAASDPDASYERVETARIKADSEDAAANRALEQQRIDDQRHHNNQMVALKLTEIDVKRDQADADREANAQEARLARRETKPGATKKKG